MFVAYVAKWLRTKWATITNIGTVVPGDLHYGRKVGATAPYGRFTITTAKVEHVSDGLRHVDYTILLEIYAENPTEADSLAIDNILDSQSTTTSSLLAVLVAAAGTAISSGAGTPGGTLNYAWRSTPPSESLQTDEERRSLKDVNVTKWAAKVRIQWPA